MTSQKRGAGCHRLPQKSKGSDSNGIRAEDIKTCDDARKEMIRLVFNELTRQDDRIPETWPRM